jgi:hypothetical protein
MKMKEEESKKKIKIREEDFDRIDTYLDACIYEARKEDARDLQKKKRHSIDDKNKDVD